MNELGTENRKRKSRLAVFEHVSHKPKKTNLRKLRSGRHLDDSADFDLVIDDDDDGDKNQGRKRVQGVRLVEEPLNLVCVWNYCKKKFTDYGEFIEHLGQHAQDATTDDGKLFSCLWKKCTYQCENTIKLHHHATYHGYHAKLQNIGNNVLERIKLPKCTHTVDFVIPEAPNGYTCEWANCCNVYSTFYAFTEHIKVHINANPKYCKKGEVIDCNWIGCSSKFSSQYKLSDHLRSHTKERVIACPDCGNMFATKTKFCDHRRRQLPIELQSYQCSQCSKLFPTERLLRDHIRAHVNHYKCTMCDMTCPKPSILAKHIRYRHLNERPFKCDHCDHSCVTKQNLDLHLLTHCKEKLLECEDCDFRCRSAHGLDKHYQLVHGTGYAPTYQCHCCQKEYSRGNFLTRHLMKEHDFHWPSGHSRFRYKEDPDGIFRLQTVRYESLEVTQQMMATSSQPLKKITPPANFKYDLKVESSENKLPTFVLVVSEDANGDIEQDKVCTKDNNIVITIDDVDEKGNVIHSETVESTEIICTRDDLGFDIKTIASSS